MLLILNQISVFTIHSIIPRSNFSFAHTQKKRSGGVKYILAYNNANYVR